MKLSMFARICTLDLRHMQWYRHRHEALIPLAVEFARESRILLLSDYNH